MQALDTVSRDLEWQLIMAQKNANNGIATVISHARFFEYFHENSKNCIWLGRFPTATGDTKGDEKLLKDCHKKNTKFMLLPDEGGIYSIKNYHQSVKTCYFTNKISNSAFKKVLFWGKYQKQIVEEIVPEASDKYTITGVPRFDLCKHEYKWLDQKHLREIKNKYKNYILVNTSFSRFNTCPKRVDNFSQRAIQIATTHNASDKEAYDQIFNIWNRHGLLLIKFVLLVKELAFALPNSHIILRPHPGEALDIYKKAFQNFPNVIINREGDIRPWLRAASLVIQSNCSTGLEASLMSTPVINYIPDEIKDSKLNNKYIDRIGNLCTNITDILYTTDNMLNGTNCTNTIPEGMKEIINNINEDSIPILKNVLIDETKKGLTSTLKFSISELKNLYGLKSVTEDFVPDKIMEFWCMLNKHNSSSAKIRSIGPKHIAITPN